MRWIGGGCQCSPGPGVKPAEWSRWNGGPGAVGFQPAFRASVMAAATADGRTGSAARPIQLLPCGWQGGDHERRTGGLRRLDRERAGRPDQAL